MTRVYNSLQIVYILCFHMELDYMFLFCYHNGQFQKNMKVYIFF
jgi:hypothetical protein